MPGGDLSAEELLRLQRTLATAVETRTSDRVTSDETPCDSEVDCVSKALSKADVREVLVARAFKGPRRIRVVVASHRVGVMSPSEATTDFPTDGAWDAPARALAERMYPEQSLSPATSLPEPSEAAHGDDAIGLPVWIAYGVAAASGGVAIGFGLSNRAAASRLEAHDYSGDEYYDLVDRMRSDGKVANVMLGVAAVGLVAGAVLLVVDMM